jgi:predicted nucleic acid-binding protein
MSVANFEVATFLDTNVFAYSFDGSAPQKQRIARQLIAAALKSQQGAIST